MWWQLDYHEGMVKTEWGYYGELYPKHQMNVFTIITP